MTEQRSIWFSVRELGRILKKIWKSVFIKRLLAIIKILAGISLLILSIQEIHWDQLVEGIHSANLAWLALAIISVLVGLAMKLWRWVNFIGNYQIHASLAKLYRAYFVGQAVNIILPFRGGELVRIGYFADEPKVLPEVATTIVLEKYLDLLALTICGLLLSINISLDLVINLRGWFLALTSIVTVLLLAALFFGPAFWGKIRTKKLLPFSMMEWLDRWVETSQWLRNPTLMFPGILLTVIIWGMMWLTNLFVFKSLGIPLGGTAAGLVLILVYVGLLPALMPGNIGPFYFFAQLALLPYAISHDQAFLFAVVLHAIVTVPPLVCGSIGLLVRPSQAVIQ